MPMVTMFSKSLRMTARPNSSKRPSHMNKTMSTLGVLSVNPDSNANKVGMVAACNAIAANQPNVSAEILLKCVVKKSTIVFLILSKLILFEFMIAFGSLGVDESNGMGHGYPIIHHKRCDVQF